MWRQPDQCQTRCFDQPADKCDLGAAKPIRQVAEEDARHDKHGCKDGECRPCGPSSRDKKQGTECSDCERISGALARS